MDICHLKNAELEPKFQKYKGRVVLRGDIVKDGSGFYAAFTEQVASQMTAAKVMVKARLQTADAVSAVAHVQTSGYVYHDTSGPNHGLTFEEPVVLLERNLYGHSVAALLA